MRILITGGAGFIGSALTVALDQRGDEVTVLDNLSPQIHGHNAVSDLTYKLPSSVKFIRGDVRNRSDLENAVSGQEVIVHLAAETGTGQSMYEVDKYVDVNVRGTALLMDVLAKKEASSSSVRRLVVASSRAIYGEGKYQRGHRFVYPEMRKLEDLQNGIFDCRDPESGEIVVPVPTDEKSKIHPTSIYGITKQVQEQLVLVGGAVADVETISLRFQNVYGPGQSLKNPYTGILSIFSTLLLQGKDVNVFEDGKESRDFVYIDDVIAATISAIDADSNGEAYNIGTGVSTDVHTVACRLKHYYESNGRIRVSGNFRIGDIRHNIADLNKAKRDLGFSPKFDFEAGLKLFTDWVKSQKIEDAGFERSLCELKDKGLLK